MDRNSPIVVFDSGVGGISVLRALVRELPREHFVYFGDSANAPYGTRQKENIRELTLSALKWLKEEYDFKAAVIACNTATAAAIQELRAAWPKLPVIGIEPALKPAAYGHNGGTVVVMATEMTLCSEKYLDLFKKLEGKCQVVPLACPELVEFVERGETDGSELEDYLRQKLTMDAKIDAVVLGCTHFPFARELMRGILPEGTEILDGSDGTARRTHSLLTEFSLLREEGEGEVTILNSSEDSGKIDLCRRLFNM